MRKLVNQLELGQHLTKDELLAALQSEGIAFTLSDDSGPNGREYHSYEYVNVPEWNVEFEVMVVWLSNREYEKDNDIDPDRETLNRVYFEGEVLGEEEARPWLDKLTEVFRQAGVQSRLDEYLEDSV